MARWDTTSIQRCRNAATPSACAPCPARTRTLGPVADRPP